MLKPIAKVTVDDPATQRQANTMVDAINELVTSPILRGRIIDDISTTAGQRTRVRHGLGRKLRGWMLIKSSVTVSNHLYDEQASNSHEDRELWLYLNDGGTDGTYKISLWVF